MIFTLGGDRTRNPQIRSLVRYPIAPRGQRTRPLPRLTQWQPSIFVTSLFIHLYFFIFQFKLLPLGNIAFQTLEPSLEPVVIEQPEPESPSLLFLDHPQHMSYS